MNQVRLAVLTIPPIAGSARETKYWAGTATSDQARGAGPVRIEGHDRAGLERLLRYYARPFFALCGAHMRLIAFVTDPPAAKTILAHLSEPTSPPEVARARGPRLWEQAPEPVANWDEVPAPVPEFVFDQRLGW